ncbi:restriction endonuclease [Streptomyces sp. NPDC006314]|uniref:restriction endonuclease n=1 Tax=Streptomyces sp. NPDC006314 TaxID=3154475 RepID=UPI0033A399FC
MTVPARRVRHLHRDRRFDLRTTTLFFVLLAIILCVMTFLARIAVSIVERRPVWAGLLVVMGIAVVLMSRTRWRRLSAARCARRAAEALEEAAETASDSLGSAHAAGTMPSAAGTGAGEENVTAVLEQPVDCAELDADGFEQAIADLCVRDGCREVEVVGGAGDLGADVTAFTPDGRRVIIQCKRYGDGNKVGSQDMQRFGGTCFTVHGADVAAVVTTSDFTAPALEYAQQCGIVCVNGLELNAWCDGTGSGPWDMAVADTC